MAKIDKNLYTKEQYKILKAAAKADKLVVSKIEKVESMPMIQSNTAFSPDYLVAVDTKMIVEINKAGYQRKNTVWTNPNKIFARMEGFNFFQPSKGWSSGPTALWLASQHGYNTVYILGFDYKGTNDGNHFNNIYADTENYKKSKDTATYYGNWLRQTKTVIEENKNIQYIRVIASDNFIPDELNKIVNMKHITVDTFKKMYSLS